MGSRTGSSYTRIAGKGSYIRGEVQTITVSLDRASVSASPEEFQRAAIAGAKILIHSNPGLSAVYYSIKISEKIIEWYPGMEKAYNEEGEQGVAKFLVKKLVEIGVNVAISYAINEVIDMGWDTAKTKLNLDTTTDQDNIAKFILGESAQILVNAAREGKPLTKDFFVKEIINVGIDCFINSLSQSSSSLDKNDPALSPFNSYSKLTETQKKLLRVTIQEVSHQIAGHIYDEVKRKGKMPQKYRMRKLIAQSINEISGDRIELGSNYDEAASFSHPNIVATDQVEVSKSSSDMIMATDVRVNKRKMKKENIFGFNPDKQIKKYVKPHHMDLLNLASLLYKLEYKMKDDRIKKKTRPKSITIYTHTDFDDESKVIVEQLATHLLDEHQSFHFEKLEYEESEISKNREKADAICLFSGGIDSLSGYYWAKQKKFGSVKCVFVNHTIHKVKKHVNNQINALGIQDDFYSNFAKGGGRYLQQTRGFLFLTTAAVYADIFNAKNVVLSECGVTKYLPSFSPSDEVTKTTSPLMLKLADRLYKKMGINFDLKEPFDDSTKAEIISKIKDQSLIKMTHSCRKSNMRTDKHDCGHCLNCLIKLLGLTYVTGEKQNQFLLDPITNPTGFSTYNLNKNRPWRLNYERYEPIKQLVNFCTGVLSGGESLHWATKRSIDWYNKRDLYKRFSEDIVYGLSYMKQKGMVRNKEILNLINRYESEKWFDKDRISKRRIELLTGI